MCVLHCICLTPRSLGGWKKQGQRHSEMRSAEPKQRGGQWHCFITSICPQSTAEKREWWLDRHTNSLSAQQLRKMGLWLWRSVCALCITLWLTEDKINVIIYQHVTLPAGGTLVYCNTTTIANPLFQICRFCIWFCTTKLLLKHSVLGPYHLKCAETFICFVFHRNEQEPEIKDKKHVTGTGRHFLKIR